MEASPSPLLRVGQAVLGIGLIGGLGFIGYQSYTWHQELQTLRQTHAALERTHSETLDELQSTQQQQSDLEREIATTNSELNEVLTDLRREQNRNEEFIDQIESLAGTVSTLNKLSKTDRELLQKYSRTYFLNENFIPSNLTQIDDDYILPGKKDQYFHGDAISFLTDMLDAAARAGHDIKIISAYRSFDEQQELKGQFTQVYGSGANTFSADQGYSEHQLGTAVDIVDVATGATSQSFAQTEAYEWLLDNAHRYGFILSYPEGNNFYIFEPWHWRFVGRDLARDLNRTGDTFYDRSQRDIDEYLIKIFD